jgi:nitroreductase
MELLEGIRTRRSIRAYTDQPITREQLREIIHAGTMAPSGMNNQPWRFVTIQSKEILEKLAQFTRYSHIIGKAPACIAVFVDRTAMYHEVKDHQSMGACIENLLLASHGIGLGAVWLGEILKNAKEVRELCGLSSDMELMAVVALGHPAGKGGRADRRPVEEVLLKEL